MIFFSYLLPEKTTRGKQKTAVCRRTTSPRWEQTVSWDDLTMQEVADRCLELTVWDHDRLGHSDFLGGVRFNLGTGNFLTRNIKVNSCIRAKQLKVGHIL